MRFARLSFFARSLLFVSVGTRDELTTLETPHRTRSNPMTTINCRAICGVLISAFVFAAPSGLLSADKQQEAKTASKMQTPKEGYLLSVSTSKQNYTGDEPVMLNVILTNVSKQDSDIIVGSPIGLYDIKIIKPNFQKAVITQQCEKLIERGQSGMSMLTTLKSGGRRVDTINVNRLYEPFLPGKYRISVARRIKKRSRENEYTTLESNSVFFTVVSNPVVVIVKPGTPK